MSAEKLYTPDLLALTVELANWPSIENHPRHGEARSKTCGSSLAIDLAADADGRIKTFGLRVRACAVGQASAAIFARHAKGCTLDDLTAAHDRIEGWLDGEAPIAQWPDLDLIAAAREYPGRHGAIILPWKAAISALSTSTSAG